MVLCRSATAQQVVWELRPYVVDLVVTADGSARWGEIPQQIENSLPTAAQETLGRTWQVRVAPLEPRDRAALAERWRLPLDNPAWQSPPPATASTTSASAAEKFIALHLDDSAAGPRVSAREWDQATASWGPAVRMPVADVRDLPRAATTMLLQAFSAQGRIRKIEGKTVEVRCRLAGGIVRSPRWSRFQTGAILRLARLGGGLSPAERTMLEETFLVVKEVNDLAAVCTVVSRFVDPLQQLPGGAESWLALEHGHGTAPTRLRLARQDGSPVDPRRVTVHVAGRSIPATDDGYLLHYALQGAVVSYAGRTVAARLVPPGLRDEMQLVLPLNDQTLPAESVALEAETRIKRLHTRVMVLLQQARQKATAGDDPGGRLLWERARDAMQQESQALTQRIESAQNAAASEDADAQAWWEWLRNSVTKRCGPQLLGEWGQDAAGRGGGGTPGAPTTPAPAPPASDSPAAPAATPAAPG